MMFLNSEVFGVKFWMKRWIESCFGLPSMKGAVRDLLYLEIGSIVCYSGAVVERFNFRRIFTNSSSSCSVDVRFYFFLSHISACHNAYQYDDGFTRGCFGYMRSADELRSTTRNRRLVSVRR